MARAHHVFSEIFLHVTWHCLESRPLITEAAEPILFDYIRDYCRKTDGVYLKELGGARDHVHLAMQVEPFIAPSDLIGKIKGASAHELNERLGGNFIHWQRGYGVVSFARRNLGAVARYITNQKEHHRRGTIRETLERINAEIEAEMAEAAEGRSPAEAGSEN